MDERKVLTDKEIDFEKARVVFAVGAIVFLYYVRQIPQHPITLVSGSLGPLSVLFTTDNILYLWGIYVIAIAVTFSSRTVASSDFGTVTFDVLRFSYLFAKAAYLLGVALIVVYVIVVDYANDLILQLLGITVFLVLILLGKVRIVRVGKHGRGSATK